MQVQFLEEAERLIARPDGRLDAAQGDSFASAVQERLQPDTKNVTVDLDRLDAVELAGVRSILRLARSLKVGRRSIDFAHGGEAVRETLRQAGFDELFAFSPPFISHRGTPR